VTPSSAICINWHVHCIAVSSTAGCDDHSVGSAGLMLVNSCGVGHC
jgi:hypothetical protein